MFKNEYSANEALATPYRFHRAARANYSPKATMGPVELFVKTAAIVLVIVAIGFLLAGGF